MMDDLLTTVLLHTVRRMGYACTLSAKAFETQMVSILAKGTREIYATNFLHNISDRYFVGFKYTTV